MTTPLQNAFLPDARRNGQVVAEFAQAETVPFKTVALNKDGYCAGLTLHWLSLRLTNQPWPKDQGSTEGVNLAAKASATYAKYVAGNDQAMGDSNVFAVIGRGIMGDSLGVQSNRLMQIRGALNATAPSFNLIVDPGMEAMTWSDQRGEDFAHEVAVRGYGLYYLSIAIPSGGSHAIAIHVLSSAFTSGVDFFDPNIGHLHYGNANEFRWSFARLLSSYRQTDNLNFVRGYALRMTRKAFQ